MVVKSHIIPYFQKKNLRLDEIRGSHIQQYYNELLANGLSAASIRRHHANIRKALQSAFMLEYINSNPADRVQLPRNQPFTPDYYNRDELNRLLKSIRGERIETPVLLAIYYGLRRSEVIGLRWSAIDFESKTLSIEHTVVGAGNNMVAEDTTKTQSSRRSLPLIPEVEKYLSNLKAIQRKRRQEYGSCYTVNDYICVYEDGTLMTPDFLTRKFKEHLQNCEHRVIRFHDLRHSSASLLVQNGFSLKEIQEWLGHSDITTTNMYSHLVYDSKENMAHKVAQKLQINGS